MSKIWKILLWALLGFTLAGCASQHHSRKAVFQAPTAVVAPKISYSSYYAPAYSPGYGNQIHSPNLFPHDPAIFIIRPGMGYLQISPSRAAAPLYPGDAVLLPVTVFQRDGKRVKSAAASPEMIELPQGEYIVILEERAGARGGTFLAIIKPGMITEIDPAALTPFASN